MEILLHSIPALIRMTLVFFLVLALIRKKFSLGNAFMLGSLCLGLMFTMPPGQLAMAFIRSAIDPKTIALAAVVTLILVLSQSMEQAGQLQRLLAHFHGLLSTPRLNLVLFPALIGLLRMPGGAVFSAPMVKELGAKSGLSDAKLSFINYWFRHIWEYWWPLYPGILLMAAIANIPLVDFIPVLGPFTLIAFLCGYGVLKRAETDRPLNSEENGRKKILPLLHGLLPILLVIVVGIGLGVAISRWAPQCRIAKEAGLVVALLLAIGKIYLDGGFKGTSLIKTIFDRDLAMMIYMVFAILIFKGVMEDSRAVNCITGELHRLSIPLVLIVAFLPFMIGAISGITIAFVGSAFPILIPLIHAADPSGFMPAYLMLAMVGGFTGVLISPVHLCLILSNGYFGAKPGDVYRYLAPACLRLVAAGYAVFWILKNHPPS